MYLSSKRTALACHSRFQSLPPPPKKQNSNDEKWFTVTRCLPDPILIIISAVIMGN